MRTKSNVDSYRMRPLSILPLVILILALATSAFAADPILRWQLSPDRLVDGRFHPLFGANSAVPEQSAVFAEGPPSLRFDAEAQRNQHLLVGDKLSQLSLPEQAITVSAWVQVDKPLEWGGVVGAIQDNGNYERGWVLGFRNQQFCFGLSTVGKQRLTYLTDPRMFEPGYWYHVVGTYDGATQRLYVDGEKREWSGEQSGPIAYPDEGVFAIGAYRDADELHALTGKIEQVSIWDRGLSNTEIQRLFESRKSAFPEIDAVRPVVTDWPTYQRDNQRTGHSPDELPWPLNQQWVVQVPRPRPAWPAPARQDFWHNKTKLDPRVTYDRANHVIAVGDAVWFGSSATDELTCLEASTGEQRWTFFAEAPIRLAPTYADGKLLFGADDGRVYCLNAADGELLWRFDAFEDDRRIPGNGRIISDHPVRTGVIVEDGTAYFCSGLFPTQGVKQYAVNVQTGELIDSGPLDVSPQGYTERRAGRLYLPTGRDPAGAFAAELIRRGKGVGREVSTLAEEYRYAFIRAGSARIGGGDGKVAAFAEDTGEELWSTEVDGKALSLAVAQGRLFVSTDAGEISCFSPGQVGASRLHKGFNVSVGKANWVSGLQDIDGKGYCLFFSTHTGALLELAQVSDMQIVAVGTDPKEVALARSTLSALGGNGVRVVVHQLQPGQALPYTDYLFNCVISDAVARNVPAEQSAWPLDELKRVVRPGDGVLVTDLGPDGRWTRPPLDNAGSWTHQYGDAANSACSQDELVSGPLKMQWFGRPGPRDMIDRHHRTSAPLFSDGYLFIPGNDRLYSVDAYNGAVMWEREFPESRRIAVFRDCSQLAAAGRTVYVAAEDHCDAIDARSGEVLRTFQLPEADGPPREWNYLAVVGDTLYGSTSVHGASRREMSREVAATETYWDDVPLVGSESLFAYDRNTGELRWSYAAADGLIVNPTLTISEGRLLLVESSNRATLTNGTGRATPQQLLGQGAKLRSLDATTGSLQWEQEFDFRRTQHNVYLAAAPGRLVAVGSRNSTDDRDNGEVLYDVQVFNPTTGESLWKTTQQQGTKIGGDHGEQDHHPVIVGEMLFCEPFAYNLATGAEISGWGWNPEHRRGCGNISASADSFFFRQSNPTMFDLSDGAYRPVTTVSRPGCWINMIPAGGLLLVPEASSGCTCNYPVQSSFALIPVGEPVTTR